MGNTSITIALGEIDTETLTPDSISGYVFAGGKNIAQIFHLQNYL